MSEGRDTMIGFIGLGIMGYPMASNLAKKGNLKLKVWNRSGAKSDQFVKEHEGCEKAATAREVVASCSRVYCMLSTLEASEAVFEGPDGILAGVHAATEIVDCATLTVDRMQLMYTGVTGKGGKFIEAPVSGSKGPAEQGTLIFLCGGDQSVYDKCGCELDHMGKAKYFLGEIGQGTKAKLVVNVTMGTMLGALAEGLEMTQACKLDQTQMVEILGLGACANPMYKLKGPAMSKTEAQATAGYPPAFPLKHALKDIRFAVDQADKLGLDMPTAKGAQSMYERALDEFGDSDFAAVREAARKSSGGYPY